MDNLGHFQQYQQKDAPCPLPFTKENELRNIIKRNWELIKYNEDFGHLHKTDDKLN